MSVCRGLSLMLSFFGVLEGLPRMLVPGQVILFPLLFANTMSMCSGVVQFGRPLVVFVMRSVVVTSGHSFKGPLSARTWCGLPWQACRRDQNTPKLFPRASDPLRHPLFHCVRRQYGGRVPQGRAAQPLSRVHLASSLPPIFVYAIDGPFPKRAGTGDVNCNCKGLKTQKDDEVRTCRAGIERFCGAVERT
jgi:hypothetical protein